jgi:hypothetical protein
MIDICIANANDSEAVVMIICVWALPCLSNAAMGGFFLGIIGL